MEEVAGASMGVFSYLSLKRPANFIWKAFSPGRDLEEKVDGGSQRTLNSSGGDISLASGASGASGVTEQTPDMVTLKDLTKEDVKREWLMRRDSEQTEGGQERLVGGRGGLSLVTSIAGQGGSAVPCSVLRSKRVGTATKS